MDTGTVASTSTPKIPAPAPKPHQLTAKTVYSLITVTHTRRVKINDVVRKVYSAHLGGIDVAFEDIPEQPMKRAVEELREKLPDVFEQCEGDWYGIWVLHNRHRGRFRGKKINNQEGIPVLGGGEGQGGEEKS